MSSALGGTTSLASAQLLLFVYYLCVQMQIVLQTMAVRSADTPGQAAKNNKRKQNENEQAQFSSDIFHQRLSVYS